MTTIIERADEQTRLSNEISEMFISAGVDCPASLMRRLLALCGDRFREGSEFGARNPEFVLPEAGQ